MSKRELAKRVGVTDSAICQYESEKRTPSIQTLKKLAEVLECSVDELIKEKKEDNARLPINTLSSAETIKTF